MLTIYDFFNITNGEIGGAEAETAILDGGVEIDRVKFSGKCQSGGRYRRSYTGKLGLSAKLASGPGCIAFEAVHVWGVIPAL